MRAVVSAWVAGQVDEATADQGGRVALVGNHA